MFKYFLKVISSKYFQILPIKLGIRKYGCPICSKIMSSPADIKRHVRIHTGEKPFKCDFCNFAANVKCTLKSHVAKFHTSIVNEMPRK